MTFNNDLLKGNLWLLVGEIKEKKIYKQYDIS